LNKGIFWGLETEVWITRRGGLDYETEEVLLERTKADKGIKRKNDNIAVFLNLSFVFSLFLRKSRPLRGR
jgi:hypothetical protein